MDLMMSQNIPELKEFIIHDIKRTGVHLGAGSYGDVEELCWNGTKCAGKRLHDTLLGTISNGTSKAANKFVSECKIIAKIRHPNIVMFLGLCFFRDHNNQSRPVLVMEKLNDNLNNLLEEKPNIQLAVKCSILMDIIRGLVHLHSHNPPIAHRDLTSRNILLTNSLQAKIADLGTARMLSSGKSNRMLHTPMPGAPIFMPPEATGLNIKYDPIKLDVFSFGHIMLHTLTQVFPCDLLPPTYEDPPGTNKIKGRNELERRIHYMEILYSQFKKGHVLTDLITACLSDNPKKRPKTIDAMSVIEVYHLELENAGEKCNLYPTLIVDKPAPEKKVLIEKVDDTDFDAVGEMRLRAASFLDTHILKGHPSVLQIYQAGGGMFRRHGEWKEYTFKITDGKLQYSLQQHLQNELTLAKVEYVKGYWSPNSPKMFPFHVHFKGRNSPWILSAHSNEERQSWMEAIKPGSTSNQWVRSPSTQLKKKSDPKDPLPPTPPPRPPTTYDSTPYIPASRLFTQEHIQGGLHDDGAGTNTTDIDPTLSLRPILRSLISECTYVPLSELNIPGDLSNQENSSEDAPGEVNLNSEVRKSYSPYMQIIRLVGDGSGVGDGEGGSNGGGGEGMTDGSNVTLEDEIIKELGEQFDPVQVDLLIQMFQTWLSPPPKQQDDPTDSLTKNRKTSIPAKTQREKSNSLTVSQSLESIDPLSPRHLGYAKEGRSDPYRCLADIALKLNKIQAGRNEKMTTLDRKRNFRHGAIYESIADSFLRADNEDQQTDENDEEKSQVLLRTFTRKNAIKGLRPRRQRSMSEGSRPEQVVQKVELRHPKVQVSQCDKPVGTLCSLLKQASTEELLNDTESEYPKWSKANTRAVSFFEVPKANRISMYDKDNEYDLFLSREDLVDFQEIGEGQFGPVYRANRVTENFNVPVALKPIKSRVSTETDISTFLREMSILKCVRHPNIARVYGLVDEANWIVMEYLSNGDLKNYLIYNKPPLSHILKYMLDISMGMHYLSAKGLVHRKLAARNILVSENEVCKVADLHLGSRKELVDTEDGLDNSGVKDPNKPIRWMAPESLLLQRFSTASDVWSFGVVIWEMFNPGKLPYDESDDRVCVERIVNGYTLDTPKDCPETVMKIMKACWYQNPGSRPSFLYMSTLLSNAIIEYR